MSTDELPHAMSTDSRTRVDELVAAFAATVPFTLDDFQVEAIRKLEMHRGVLVSAPTSSGKTVVAEYAIWRALAAPHHLRRRADEPHRVIYTTPLKALSNQKYHDLVERYGESRVGLVTGEHSLNDGASVVVMTTEILRNLLYDDPGRADLVGDVVLDEVHYIDDHPRGTVWEEIIIEAPRHVRLIGLSATISNVAEVAEWMTTLRGEVATVVRTERPVELKMWLGIASEFHALFDSSGTVHRRTLELAQNEGVHEARNRYVRRAPENDLLRVLRELASHRMLPAIYFIFSRRGCREALMRCAVHGVDLTSDVEKAQIDRIHDERLAAVQDDDEREVYRQALGQEQLRRGVSMHHAGMLPYAKETVERLFQLGLIKVVFATETLSLGLNMPARACVVSSFTKFDGQQFASLTPGQLTQLMGRAGRRGIDTIGHGIILKEQEVDVGDIYDAAIGGEMSVLSKFQPTYTMTLSLLRTRSVALAEELLLKSFGQFQYERDARHWVHKQENLREQLSDLRGMVYRHPRVACNERTLTDFLRASQQVGETELQLRRSKRDHWRDQKRGRYGGRNADPGGRIEALRRSLHGAEQRVERSPCKGCPLLGEHRAHRFEVESLQETLQGGEQELRLSRDRYRREFRALRGVLSDAGFLADDKPTRMGELAGSMYGESSLLVAMALSEGWFDGLDAPELAAVVCMVSNEDRGRDRRPPQRPHFPTDAVDAAWRRLRGALRNLTALEDQHGIASMRDLSLDYVGAAYGWVMGIPLTDLPAPDGTDLGDVVKAIKNLYSMLRQMEQATRGHPLHELIVATRDRCERDLIRRV